MYDFVAEESEELSLKKGDVVEVLDKEDPNWWLVKEQTGERQGLVPSNYIQLVKS